MLDPCISQPCGHGGSCIIRKDSFQCVCKKGFSGDFCENGVSCTRDCPKNTECIGGQCCGLDTTGKQCKIFPDDCSCLNGGLCSRNTSDCICADGWEGTLCENDIDECIQNPHICGHGICVNQPGSFKCYCEPGIISFIFLFRLNRIHK